MKKTITCVLFGMFLTLTIWMLWANTAPVLSVYEVNSHRLPEAFEGYRIAQISDLHNAQLGENNSRLLTLLEKAEPDIILITGDLVDCHRADVDIAFRFVQAAVKIAPCYYVTGNHEITLDKGEYLKLEKALLDSGVIMLGGSQVNVEKDGAAICLMGLNDAGYNKADKAAFNTALGSLSVGDDFTVLLSHRPERFSEYCALGADLVFSGHAHGGQFRLPFVGGLYAPGQGLLPEYDSGLYTDGGTQMLVSRGIGNSLFPMRFNNRPEIILAVLHTD